MSCLNRFKGWCQENFPFIEDDFNAITDYQLMCKLKEYVVSIGNDVANLEIDYNELAGQIAELEEIVNSMDGEFDDLVEEFNSLKTLVESYNMRIIANANRIEQVNTNLQQLISLNINDVVALINNLKDYVDSQDTLILAEISTINNNILLIRKDMEVIAEGIPKVRDTGTVITLNDTIKDAPIDIKLDPSELSQDTTTGANLMKYNARTSSYFNYKCDEKGQVTASGTNTTTGITLGYNLNSNLVTIEPGTYTLNVIGTYTNVRFVVNGVPHTVPYTFTTTETSTILVEQNFYKDITYNVNYYITLASGTTATTERYTGGIPQPNPTYPSDVHVISGDNSIVVSNSDNTLSQTKPLTLGDIEYCKIGTYQDKFFKAIDGDSIYDTLDSTTKASLTSGKWYIQGNVGKTTLTDVASLQSSTVFGTSCKLAQYSISDMVSSGRNYNFLCNKVHQALESYSQYAGYLNARSLYVMTDASDTTENYNSKVSGSVLYYRTDTPTYILLNDTLQNELDDIYETLKAYDEQTNITQINHDLPFNMTAITMKKGSVTDEV